MAYTDNLAQGLILAAFKGAAAGKAYWITDERPYSMHDVVRAIKQALRA